jgi:hypothetical protein
VEIEQLILLFILIGIPVLRAIGRFLRKLAQSPPDPRQMYEEAERRLREEQAAAEELPDVPWAPAPRPTPRAVPRTFALDPGEVRSPLGVHADHRAPVPPAGPGPRPPRSATAGRAGLTFGAPPRPTRAPRDGWAIRALRGDPARLRQAIALAAILGPPRALEPAEPGR